MKVTLEDALSLLNKYAEEGTPVLAVFVTPSISVARVVGTIRVSMVDGSAPHLVVGKEDGETGALRAELDSHTIADCTATHVPSGWHIKAISSKWQRT